MVRVLEVLVGLGLGCVALFITVALFAFFTSGERVGALVGALVAGLMLFGASKLIRGPRSTAPRSFRRWLALAGWLCLLALPVAIAVPNFLQFGKRSVTSEPRLVLSVIRIAEESYFAEFGEYLSFGPTPSGPPGATPVSAATYSAAEAEVFERLGWFFDPEFSPVYCRYAVAVGSVREGAAQAFTAEAICDIDGDGDLMAWGYVRPDRESGETIPGPFGRCPPEGACNASGQPSPLLVGPCDAESGRTVF